jgi:bifunctional non-homologous end joining protein LigD
MPYARPKPPAGGIKANYPGFIPPALANSITKVPSGDRWIYEIKFDGYRVQVHLRDAAVQVFKHACKTGLEGVVSKVRDSRYVSGRVNDWAKKTCAQRETLTIADFALKANQFDGLYVGRLKGKELIYAGKIDHGFDKVSAKDLQDRLKPLIRKSQPYAKKVAHRGIWVEPSLLAEVEYRAKSAEGKLRHPFFKGIREDL